MTMFEQSYYIHFVLFSLLTYGGILSTECRPQDNRNIDTRNKRAIQPCSKFSFEGYHCVPEDKCNYDGYEIDDTVEYNEIRAGAQTILSTLNNDFDATQYSCDSDFEICCRKTEYFGEPEPIIRPLQIQEYDCEQFEDFGYQCVGELECGEDGYYIDDIASDALTPRTFGSFASRMSCKCIDKVRNGFQDRVCCRKSTFFNAPEPPGI